MARIIINDFLYWMEMLDHADLLWLAPFATYHLMLREKSIWIASCFADGGNRTQAACTATKCVIDYSILGIFWTNIFLHWEVGATMLQALLIVTPTCWAHYHAVTLGVLDRPLLLEWLVVELTRLQELQSWGSHIRHERFLEVLFERKDRKEVEKKF